MPTGYIYYGATYNGQQDFSEATWAYFILPFIEQQGLFDTVNYNLFYSTGDSFGQIPNQCTTVATTRFSLIACPSDNPNSTLGFGGAYIRGNYVANAGIGPMTSPSPPSALDHVTAGVFYNVSKMDFAYIIDGTSNTVFMSETINPVNNDMRGVRYYTEGPQYEHNYTPYSGTDQIRVNQCVSDPAAPLRRGVYRLQ